MRNHTLVSVDVAKNVLEVAVSYAAGRVSQRKRLSRNQFLKFYVQQQATTFLLEACSSSHYWGRRLRVPERLESTNTSRIQLKQSVQPVRLQRLC